MRKFYNSHSKHSINAGNNSSCTSSTSNRGRNSNNSRNYFATSCIFLKKITNLVLSPYTWEYYIPLKLPRDIIFKTSSFRSKISGTGKLLNHCIRIQFQVNKEKGLFNFPVAKRSEGFRGSISRITFPTCLLKWYGVQNA